MRRLRYSALKKKAMPCFAARTNAKACLGTIKQRDSGIFYDLAVFFYCMENLYMAEKSTNSRKCLDIGIRTAYNRENRLIVD